MASGLESRRPSAGHARRGKVSSLAAAFAVALGWLSLAEGAPAPRPAFRLGVSVATTGSDARWGGPILQGVQLAVEDVNRRGGAGGHPLETLLLDSSAPGADTLSRQRATVASYERFVADPAVIAAIGPQTSEESRASSP